MIEAQMIEGLKKATPKKIDDILAGKFGFYLLIAEMRATYKVMPFIYVICALIGWNIDPAEWGRFVRFFGVFLAIFVYGSVFVFGYLLLTKAKAWLEQHGKESLFQE